MNTAAAATNIGKDLASQLTAAAQEYEQELGADAAALGEYTAERISHLLVAVNEPGYGEAVQAERDAIALMAAGRVVDKGEAFDSRILGLIQGALTTAITAFAH